MGTITLSVRDDVEKVFRRMVRERYPMKKGALGRAVTEAMELWIRERQQEKVSERALELLKLDFDLGRRMFKTRDELYD